MNIFASIIVLYSSLVAIVYGNVCTDVMKNICYYTAWGGAMPDANLCTTVIYSFADMSGGVLSGVWGNPLQSLKQANPKLKILVAVGGWNFGVGRMSEMLATVDTRERFAQNAVTFLRNLGFDGLDLDFEYPGTNYPQYGRYSPPEDKQRFSELCQQIRNAFEEEHAKNPTKDRLLLTVAFGCRKLDIDLGYEIDKLAESIDYFHLMTYDLRGGFDSIASHHSALYAGDYETGEDRVFNIDWVVNYFLDKGAPSQKLILGLASYGKSFRINSPPYELGAPAVFSEWHGYGDSCGKVKNGWQRIWVSEQAVPVAKSGNIIIGYDDTESIRLKAEYAIKMKLGGVMWWSLDHDDTGGWCGEGRYPLINTVNKVYASDEFDSICQEIASLISSEESNSTISTTRSSTISTPKPSTTTKSTTTTTPFSTVQTDDTRYSCALSGRQFVKHPTDCHMYIKCSTNEVSTCSSGLVFDYDIQACNWPYNVECTVLTTTTSGTQPTTTTTTFDSTTTVSTTVTTTTATKPTTPVVTTITSTTTQSTTTTTPLSTIQTDDIRYSCALSGRQFVKYPTDCHMYIKCSTNEVSTCSSGLVFDYDIQACNWPYNVECTVLSTTTSGTTTTATILSTTATKPTTPVVITSTTTQSTTHDGSYETDITKYDCTLSGRQFVKHPTDCHKLIKCSTNEVITCQGGTVFDFDIQACNWPYNVPCVILSTTTSVTTTPTTTTPTTTTSATEAVDPLLAYCDGDGLSPHPTQCHQYLVCYQGTVTVETCKRLSIYQLNFDINKKACDLPSRATVIDGCSKL